MSAIRLLAALLVTCCATLAQAQNSLSGTLAALAAECRIIGATALMEATDIDRGSAALVDKAFALARSCVTQAKPRGRDAYRTAVVNQSDLKPLLGETYAAWLGYMDALATPVHFGDEIAEERAFSAALNRLQAELDAR